MAGGPVAFIHLFPESSKTIKSSLTQQVSMVTRNVNMLYVLYGVRGPGRRAVCAAAPRGRTLMETALLSQLNICFQVYNRVGTGVKACGASETIYRAQRMYRHAGHKETQRMKWLLLCQA